jgi:endonuclease/exonuclease/phosphatase family metal-dependent hydrolase
VEWLFLTNWNRNWKSEAEARQHLARVASHTASLGADVIAFQEVENCYVLTELNKAMGLNLGYKEYLVTGRDTATGQNVGFLTKVDFIENLQRTENRVEYPVAGNRCNYTGGSSTSGVSKHAFSYINPQNFGRILLVTHHFLAFPTTPDRCAQREAQATVLANLIREKTTAGVNVVALGDWNDYDRNTPDRAGSVPTSRVLDIIAAAGAGSPLSNVASLVTRDMRYSSYYSSTGRCDLANSNFYTAIDHIFVSSGLRSRISSVTMFHNYPPPCAGDGLDSDHWPIVVTFRTAEDNSTSLFN